jgi:hypothetical protein
MPISRKVTRDPWTGAVIFCSENDGTQHTRAHALEVDLCEECDGLVLVCTVERRCVSCCRCGAYHSMDCDWPG